LAGDQALEVTDERPQRPQSKPCAPIHRLDPALADKGVSATLIGLNPVSQKDAHGVGLIPGAEFLRAL